VHCALVFVLLFVVPYRNQQFTFLPGRIAGYENVIQVRHCVSSCKVTALIAYWTNIDRISVMYFIEPVECGCGWHIVIVPTTEDPYVDLQGDKWGL